MKYEMPGIAALEEPVAADIIRWTAFRLSKGLLWETGGCE
jgi:hypothetical protein